MPKYTFKCHNCGRERQEIVSISTTEITCGDCDSGMLRQMPTLNGPSEVRETVNEYTGTTWRKDQKEILNERQQNYLWEVEIPRKVASGVYSTETMLEMGWVYIDDDGKIQPHTKPPHARKE